jgi:hypothetical protein
MKTIDLTLYNITELLTLSRKVDIEVAKRLTDMTKERDALATRLTEELSKNATV